MCIKDPEVTEIMISCRLEFECTNNIAKYEALVYGHSKAIDLGAQVIECYGDYEIILNHVRNKFHCILPHLINYQKLVRDMTSYFKSFNIKSVPRSQNFDA